MQPPCKDCHDRVLGCHGTCDRYKEYRSWVDNNNSECLDRFRKISNTIGKKKRYKNVYNMNGR